MLDIEIERRDEMIPESTIRSRQRKVNQLGRQLVKLNKKYEGDLIINTLFFYGYGSHIFELLCYHNLLTCKKISAIYDSMTSKWVFYDVETDTKINKSIVKLVGDFVRECKNERR